MTLAKALAAAAGNAGEAVYIDDAFSTYLYTGNGSTQTITNGIDLAGEGGLVWSKSRNLVQDHSLIDTVRGNGSILYSNLTQAADTGVTTGITAFSASGYSLGVGSFINQNTRPYASWTFRKAEKFFDVVTYTGDGTQSRQISHGLGSAPGCIFIKKTSSSVDSFWMVYHKDNPLNTLTTPNQTKNLVLNSDAGIANNNCFGVPNTQTSTFFTLGTANLAQINGSGETYVAYLFAHDAGGFGADGTENVISCGGFTTGSSGGAASVTLGYEPQWLLIKPSSTVGNWLLFDDMRGMPIGSTDSVLQPNLANAESTGNYINQISATGFTTQNLANDETYIYVAIRRPMKPPESGTEVYNAIAYSGNGTNSTTQTGVGFPPDLVHNKVRNGTFTSNTFYDRLRGATSRLLTYDTAAEFNTTTDFSALGIDGITFGTTASSGANANTFTYINHFFRRAPGFFDVVCYTGTGVDLTVNHNLGVVPEWVIIKNRSTGSTNWSGAYFVNASQYYDVRLNQDIGRSLQTMGPLGPTLISNSATAFGVLGGSTLVNSSGNTYVAYLFATYPGVSKVGSYTGTGTTQQINCGFTGGARFVLIKRTDSTGDWYVWDSARGIVAGNDPYLLLNSTAAEVTNTDYIDTYSAGFEISSTAPAAINANGGTFIFLAIA